MTTVTGPIAGAVNTPPAPPRWARYAAHAVPLLVLPSTVWRLAMAAGVPVGYSEQVLRDDFGVPGWGVLYLVLLSVGGELLALVTLLLVRPAGSRWTGWERRPSPRTVVRIAGTGAVLLTLLGLSQLGVALAGLSDGRLSPSAEAVMLTAYAPLLAWGPLLGAVTWSYARRHRT